MKYAIIVSEMDSAGNNVKDKLISSGKLTDTGEKFDGHPVYSLGDSAKLYTISTLHVESENLDKRIDADNLIFATTHKSVKNVRSLSVHTVGNWGSADMGGKPKQVVPVNPSLFAKLFRVLADEGKDLDYDITMEVVHHGPYLETPAVFIEIGSQEEEWKDPGAGEAIARTLLRTVEEGPADCTEAGFGIGGTHYCSRFNKRVLAGEFCLGHICPKYALEHLDEKLLEQCMTRSTVPIKFAVLDWKGLGQEKQRIVDLLASNGVEIKKIK